MTERHEIHVETDETGVTGEWDAARLERVLANLLSNAIKYSPGPARIVVAVMREREPEPGRAAAVLPAGSPSGHDAVPPARPAPAGWAVLSVRDQGTGIPAADLPHVFERFHRGGNVPGHIQGTGIGLSSARQIIEQHGGTITAESREGAGAMFTVRLPLTHDVP